MNERQIRFAYGIAAGKSQTQAYKDAGYSNEGATQSASKLAMHPDVINLVEERKEILALAAGVDRDWIIGKLVRIASGNPNDLMELRRRCCRYCYGDRHKYQWRSMEEYLEAVMIAANNRDSKGNPKPLPPPTMDGGFGFSPKLQPVDDCSKCDGDGQLQTHFKDTRKLKGSALAQYKGVKETKNGIEILTNDTTQALLKLGEVLGMFKVTNELSGPGGGPIPVGGQVRPEDLTDAQIAAILLRGTAKDTDGGE